MLQGREAGAATKDQQLLVPRVAKPEVELQEPPTDRTAAWMEPMQSSHQKELVLVPKVAKKVHQKDSQQQVQEGDRQEELHMQEAVLQQEEEAADTWVAVVVVVRNPRIQQQEVVHRIRHSPVAGS